MKDIERIRNIAQENLGIAIAEMELAKSIKAMAKKAKEKVSARLNYMKKESGLAKMGKNMAQKARALAEKRVKILLLLQDKGILSITDEELKREREFAHYHEQVAKVRNELAQINEKIAESENEIAENKIEFSNAKMDVAKSREKLAKIQFNYVKAVVENTVEEKILEIEHDEINRKKNLFHEQKELMNKENHLRVKENKLNDLRKKLSVKLDEFQRIQYPIDMAESED